MWMLHVPHCGVMASCFERYVVICVVVLGCGGSAVGRWCVWVCVHHVHPQHCDGHRLLLLLLLQGVGGCWAWWRCLVNVHPAPSGWCVYSALNHPVYAHPSRHVASVFFLVVVVPHWCCCASSVGFFIRTTYHIRCKGV